MREIKFRAWDKRNKEWVACVMAQNNGNPKEPRISIPVVFDGQGECVIQQYTGLYDKNGKEIYEGDIVIYNTGEKFEVKWCKRNAHFEYRQIKAKEKFLSKEQRSNISEYGISNTLGSHEAEVIGNIYENPELSN